MQTIDLEKISTDNLSVPAYKEKNLEVDILRIDKIHPVVSGNKWFKLRYYLEEAQQQKKSTIVTFGGAWSNHIVATAAACRLNNLSSIGIIRGEESETPSSTLLEARQLGMQLVFISRDAYKSKELPASLRNRDDCYIISEGGYGIKGAKGAATILDHGLEKNYTHICCAAGTGTMTAGLLVHPSQADTISVSVLKNNFQLEDDIRHLVNNKKKPVIIHDYHFGGYAKHTPALLSFMNEFYKQTGIPSDFVYTGKLFFTINDLVSNNYFKSGSKLLAIHSGGLQGNRSLSKGTLIF
ncbi:MAG TPA: pyridoxal-phosphate dependent enzyme [Chitinophagaceae bacterium]|nr:pyridoxal-phosphate dependent enzyme [Chitinophagaceae bacterium]